jgi:hypothetical protein
MRITVGRASAGASSSRTERSSVVVIERIDQPGKRRRPTNQRRSFVLVDALLRIRPRLSNPVRAKGETNWRTRESI